MPANNQKLEALCNDLKLAVEAKDYRKFFLDLEKWADSSAAHLEQSAKEGTKAYFSPGTGGEGDDMWRDETQAMMLAVAADLRKLARQFDNMVP